MGRFTSYSIIFLLLFNSQIFLAQACSIIEPTATFVTLFNMDGDQELSKKLDYFGVDVSCTIANTVVVGEGDTAYIEDKGNILTHVDFSKGRWNKIDNFDIGDYDFGYYYNILNIYDGKIVSSVNFPNIQYSNRNDSLTEYSLLIQDLETINQEYLVVNLSAELSKFGENYTIVSNQIIPSSRGRWVSLISLVNIDETGSNSTLFWVYRYDLDTNEIISFSTKYNESEDLNDFYSTFHISDSGKKGYFFNRHSDTFYFIDYVNQEITIPELEFTLSRSVMRGEKIYGISDKYLKELDLETMKILSVTQLGNHYLGKFYMLDNFYFSLGLVSGLEVIFTSEVFLLIGLSLVAMFVIRRIRSRNYRK